ncbi:hypothetical protein GCM10011349_36590 [Novosphingobium indicum]|uniref:Gfo/Idh/MocA family oxidoreductase n=1 Tax=Novosphingobium indicum TaxID=462949 RepID=A0ABQ2JZJ0_9SPHN|nr:Gfo/Idh/MocA family oxidoreductase [Novosphingobium indicum]GGN57726.1 hypothetical protein GCM10011349_36590 [Novosphingobium indicum]
MDAVATGKLVVVGCGAATEQFYLPCLAARTDLAGRLLFMDLSVERAQKLADEAGGGVATSFDDAAQQGATAAILATPHHVHCTQALEAMDAGLDLLIEKPVTIYASEAREISKKSKELGRIVMVNNTRRLFPAYQAIRTLIHSGELGALRSAEIYDGSSFEWPTVSGFYLTSRDAKGVLLDRGAHTIDILTWWFGDDLSIASAAHDGFDGPDATFHLTLKTPNGASISTKFSRLEKLSNTFELTFEHGAIKGRLFTWHKFEKKKANGPWKTISVDGFNPKNYNDFAIKMTNIFLDATFNGGESLVSPEDVVSSIQIMEEAYNSAHLFELPWYAEWEAMK